MSCFVRVRNPDGEELTIDLTELEDALQGVSLGEYYLRPKSSRIIFISSEEEMDDESDEAVIPDDEKALPIDKIESRVQFRWTEEFIDYPLHCRAERPSRCPPS